MAVLREEKGWRIRGCGFNEVGGGVIPQCTLCFVCDESNESVLKSHEKKVEFALDWFENNYMKLNADK